MCKIKLHNNNKKNRNERDMLVFQDIKTSCSDQRMKFLITNIISAMNFLHSPGVSSLRVNRVFLNIGNITGDVRVMQMIIENE